MYSKLNWNLNSLIWIELNKFIFLEYISYFWFSQVAQQTLHCHRYHIGFISRYRIYRVYPDTGYTGCIQIQDKQGVSKYRIYRVYPDTGYTGCIQIQDIQGVSRYRIYNVYPDTGYTRCIQIQVILGVSRYRIYRVYPDTGYTGCIQIQNI